jgi:hypothetical protein
MRSEQRRCVVPNRFTFTGNLEANLDQMDHKVQAAMIAGAGYTATRVESYMRANAKWTDRTGAARSGLKTTVKTSPNKVAIVLYHSVPYGVWLEVRWGGKYAILRSGLVYGGSLLVSTIGKLVFK